MKASASADSHCHGYWFVNAANRRTAPAGPGVRRSPAIRCPLPAHASMLHLMQYRPLLAAAARGAAAFADVAAAGRAHLRAAGQAERCVGAAALARLDQLHRAVRV